MKKTGILSGLALLGMVASTAAVADIQVKITNNSPLGGTYLTPAWFGFHDGSFDIFNKGAAASAGLESIAEDGDFSVLSSSFKHKQPKGIDGSAADLLAPGATSSAVFNLSSNGKNDYFSFAAMVLPSSDFFIANDNSRAFNISSVLSGEISKLSFDIARVYDAGTEVNDFATSAGNGLFGINPAGQTGPNQGANEYGVVTVASGSDYAKFLNAVGNDLAPLDFSNYGSLATIEISNVSPVPEPATALMFLPGLMGCMMVARRRSKHRS